MFFRWKDAEFGRNGIDQFFGPYPPDRHTIVRAKIWRKTDFFSKSHKNTGYYCILACRIHFCIEN